MSTDNRGKKNHCQCSAPKRFGTVEFSVVTTAANDETFSFAEVNRRAIELLEPGILVARANGYI
jgi:hypothetical protein